MRDPPFFIRAAADVFRGRERSDELYEVREMNMQ